MMTKISREQFLAAVRDESRGIEYCGETSGGRHIMEVPIEMIRRSEDFTCLRGKDPANIDLLSESTKETGGPIQMISCFPVIESDGIFWEVVDGHQRLTAEIANGATTVVIQWFESWTTKVKAFQDAVSLNFARFDPGDEDVISLLRSGKLTQAEIARRTGYSESKVSRLAKIACDQFEWLWTAIVRGILNLAMAAKLVDACGSNRRRAIALQNSYDELYSDFEQRARKMKNRIDSQRNRKWNKKARDKAKVSTYFKGTDWQAWIEALEQETIEGTGSDSKLVIAAAQNGKQKSGVMIGDKADWEREIAIYGLFEKSIEEVDPEDLNMVIEQWDDIRAILEAIRDGKDVPSLNPEVEAVAPESPVEQTTEMSL